MPINKQKLDKFCQDYSKISIDFALGNCSAEMATNKQEELKRELIFEHSGLLKRLQRKIQDFLLDF